MKTLNWITMLLVVIGGLNWGLIGLFDFDLVSAIFGASLSRVIFILVGVSALYMLIVAPKMMKERQQSMPM